MTLFCASVAGSLIQGDDSSHGSEDASIQSPSQHFPAAVANSDASYARKFGHYSKDSIRRYHTVSRAARSHTPKMWQKPWQLVFVSNMTPSPAG